MSLDPLNMLLLFLTAWTILYILSRFLPFEKFGVDVTPIYLTYRTKRLNNFLKENATRHPKFWKVASNVGIALAIGEVLVALYLLGNNLYNFLNVPQQAQAIFPLLPGITVSFRWFPYLLIALGLALTVHEVSHGVVASLEGISIKSAGIILAPITFGGFVEPDETVFKESLLVAKLRLLASGSLANLVVGLFVTIIAAGLFIPASGVLIMTVDDQSPAYHSGIRPWEVIHEINGTHIQSLRDLYGVMSTVQPHDFLIVKTSSGVRSLRTMASPTNASRGIMGVSNLVDYFALRIGEFSSQFTYHFNLLLYWISLIMINIAVFNMLPLFPLDGEAYLYSILQEKMTRYAQMIRIAMNGVSLTLLLSNIALTLLNFGLTPI